MTEEANQDAGWLQHFARQFEDGQARMRDLSDLYESYERLRVRSEKPGPSPSADSASSLALRQKTKQIESQQALLHDLQTQLSAKEVEVRDLSGRLTTSMAQASQLHLQLTSTHRLLEEQQLENVSLRAQIRDLESAGHMEIVDEVDRTGTSGQLHPSLSLVLPRKMAKSIRLSKHVVPANLIVGSGGSAGAQTVLVGPRRVHLLNALASSVLAEWDLAGGSSSATVMAGAVSPENDFVLIGSSESQLSMLEVGSGKLVKDLKGHGGKVRGCGFLNTKNKAFSVATDRTIKLWDVSRASPIRSVPVTSQISAGASTPDGTMIITSHQNGRIILWSLNERICEIPAHTDSALGLAVSPDGRFIVSIGKDDSLVVVDIHMAQAGPVHRIEGFNALENSPSVSPDSRIVSVCSKGGIQSWDLLLGTLIGSVTTDALCLAWTAASPNATNGVNQQVITAHPDGVVKWWTP